MIRKTISRKVFEVCNAAFLILLMIAAFYPVIHIVMASFSEPLRFLSHTGVLFAPVGKATLLAYENAFKHPQIMGAYGNTLFIVAAGVAVNIALTAVGAYFLSRKNVLFQAPVAVLIVITMFFSGGLIPFYFTVKDLGLYNSLWALILPVSINTFNLLVLKTGFAAVPDSIEESAVLDGAGHFTVLFRFIVPLAMPTVAVMILYYGVAHWNSWFNALLFISKPERYPLQLVLRQILLAGETGSMTMGVDAGAELAVSETIKYAVIVISTAPVLCAYPFLQKYF
ncbi:MAG: carbohydrate ABC transporter permease, partial [Clostridiales bacterium]|nr:carbohydrate ABC transporter permease [Clostridiales bacterium]